MKNILVVTFFIAFFGLIACTNQDKTTNSLEELVVLSCSGEETGVDLTNLTGVNFTNLMDLYEKKSYEKKFSSVVIKIRKVNGEPVAVIVREDELTKEKRATDPKSPYFLRWFETTKDGIITYGENTTSNEGSKWNIKLSSQGEFIREGLGMTQKGTCTVQQKAF